MFDAYLIWYPDTDVFLILTVTFFLPAFNFADAFATTTFFAAIGFFTVAGFVVVTFFSNPAFAFVRAFNAFSTSSFVAFLSAATSLAPVSACSKTL